MHLILVNSQGKRTEAVALAGGEGMLRVAARGYRDAFDLKFNSDQWFTNEGEVFDLEAITTDRPVNLAEWIGDRKTRTAGGA
jgi:hypothetical protein